MNKSKKDIILKLMVYLSSFFTIFVLLWIIGYVLTSGFKYLSFDFLISDYIPGSESSGIFPMIISTLILVLFSIFIAAPVGIFSAIYLSEYARQGKLVKIIRFTTDLLAGIPSIVYGLFGMIFFSNFLNLGFSLLSGILTVSIMVLPVIIRTTEEAIKAVPSSFREASYALGTTKLRTLFKVVLPSAVPGIITAVLLSMGRIIGETAAIYLPVGTVYNMPSGVMSSGRSLSVHLYMLAKEGISFEMAFATGSVLIMLILFLNIITKYVGRKFSVGE